MTKFYYVITSRDIDQYAYCNCFFPGCDVVNFETNLVLLIKSLFFMTKRSRQKLKYLENEKSFYSEIKSIFHHI